MNDNELRRRVKRARRPEMQDWPVWGPTGRIIPIRDAEQWKRTPRYREIECSLCYRRCVLAKGEEGWCRYRGNRDGAMQLHAHGTVSFVGKCIAGLQANPFRTYKPGQLGLMIGGTRCTAGCSFCIAGTPWARHDAPWVDDREQSMIEKPRMWQLHRGILPPQQVIGWAHWQAARSICFGVNEPMLSFEYTLDVAKLAKEDELDVYVETNGFSSPAAVRALAPYVDAVDVGIKGSLDPAFYDRWMRSPGAVPAVQASLLAWHEAGVHVTIGDVIAPPHMQDDDQARNAQRRLYNWIAEHLGPHTPVIMGTMYRPVTAPGSGVLLPGQASEWDLVGLGNRMREAFTIAREAGLAYAHIPNNIPESADIRCHACDGLLLRFHPDCQIKGCLMEEFYCPFFWHEQHAHGGRCDHCGEAVPVVTLSREELAEVREMVQPNGRIPAERLEAP